MSRTNWNRLRNALVLIGALLLLWQGVYWWTGDVALASPLATLRYTAKLVASESFDMHLVDTLRAFAIAYALSVVIGLAVGFWLGFDRLSGDALEPMIVAVYAVPKLTLYPILLLAFGLTLSAKVAFGVLHGVIPIILFTLSAVHNTKPILIKTGRVLKLTRFQMGALDPLPGGDSGNLHRAARRLRADAHRIAACRDVRVAARTGLPADERHRAPQRRAHHGGDAHHRGLRGEREHAAALRRSSAPSAGVMARQTPRVRGSAHGPRLPIAGGAARSADVCVRCGPHRDPQEG
jgi:hypothetical protein